MANRYCERCSKPLDGTVTYCDSCATIVGAPASPGDPAPATGGSNFGCGLAAIGCALPFVLAGGTLGMMSNAVDGRGGSGLVMVAPFMAGLIVGVPLFIIGLVSSAQKPKPKDEDTPPSVL